MGEEEWRHSVAPVPADRLVEIMKTLVDELDLSDEDGTIIPPSGELEPDSDEDAKDDSAHFEQEVHAMMFA